MDDFTEISPCVKSLKDVILNGTPALAVAFSYGIKGKDDLFQAVLHAVLYDQSELFNHLMRRNDVKALDFRQQGSVLLYQAGISARSGVIAKLYPISDYAEVINNLLESGMINAVDAMLTESVKRRDGLAEGLFPTVGGLVKAPLQLVKRDRKDAMALTRKRSERSNEGTSELPKRRARIRS